jgi:hypothetical protein
MSYGGLDTAAILLVLMGVSPPLVLSFVEGRHP